MSLGEWFRRNVVLPSSETSSQRIMDYLTLEGEGTAFISDVGSH